MSKFLTYEDRLVIAQLLQENVSFGVIGKKLGKDRTTIDNYWQSLYLIKHNEVEKYREFVHKRMRLHILKRDDGTDVNINELLREVDDGYFDPIPVNGDYFTKSAREYAIELGIKEDYDKFYEFNSEFIHSSLTAVYSGIMVPCRNPEHNGHLTIKNGGAKGTIIMYV